MMTHSDILDSEHGSELLAFLLLAPPRSYSTKELAQRLQISDRILANTLNEFVENSMVKEFYRDRTKLYIINHKHKLLPEIKTSLVQNQKPYEDDLFTAIRRLGEINSAFLSGAFTGQPQLPVDLLLVGKVSLSKLDEFLSQCKTMLGMEINYSIMTPDEFKLRVNTFDRFIKDIFDYPHIVVVDKPVGKIAAKSTRSAKPAASRPAAKKTAKPKRAPQPKAKPKPAKKTTKKLAPKKSLAKKSVAKKPLTKKSIPKKQIFKKTKKTNLKKHAPKRSPKRRR